MFEIGQRVVCVAYRGEDRPSNVGVENRPRIGGVYTIRDIGQDSKERLGVWLEEVVNRPVPTLVGLRERGFFIQCFRALDERRLDIFRAMLTDAGAPQNDDFLDAPMAPASA